VNTLSFFKGCIRGDCTDGFGFLAALDGHDPAPARPGCWGRAGRRAPWRRRCSTRAARA
jgi:hypothetical protein